MDVQEWKKKRVEIMKLPPLERIKKLQEIIKTVNHPLIIDDIISLLHRTAIELDVRQQQQGGTFFQPSRLELLEHEAPRTIERKVETVIIRRGNSDENGVFKKEEGAESSYAQSGGYFSKGYFVQEGDNYKSDKPKEFESKSREDLLRKEGFDDNIKKYKKRAGEEKESY